MKIFMTIAMTISFSTALMAKENIICQVTGKSFKTPIRGMYDLDANMEHDSFFNAKKDRALMFSKTGHGMFKVGVGDKEDSRSVVLEEAALLEMKEGKSFGMSMHKDETTLTCYNMKEQDKAPFDDGYMEKKAVTLMKADNIDPCSEKVIQDRMPKVNIFNTHDEKLKPSPTVSK